MPTTENPETVKLLEQGLCPGWDYWSAATREHPDGNYRTEIISQGMADRGKFAIRKCRYKARSGSDLCGLHEKARNDARQREAQERSRQVAQLARERHVSMATNLATMLSDRVPVTFSVSDDGMVTLDLESARRLLDHFNR